MRRAGCDARSSRQTRGEPVLRRRLRRSRARTCSRSRAGPTRRCPSARAPRGSTRGPPRRRGGSPRRWCPVYSWGRRRSSPPRARGTRSPCRRGSSACDVSAPVRRATSTAISARMYDSVKRFEPTRSFGAAARAARGDATIASAIADATRPRALTSCAPPRRALRAQELRDERVRGPLEELLQRPALEHTPRAQQRDLVREERGLGEIVRDDERLVDVHDLTRST